MSFRKSISKNLDNGTAKSRAARRVVIISTALCFAIITISISIEKGFRESVKTRAAVIMGSANVVGNNIWGDAQGASMIDMDSIFMSDLSRVGGVRAVYATLRVPVVLKSGAQAQGVMIKGLSGGLPDDMANILVQGDRDALQGDQAKIVISQTLAHRLNCKVGDMVDILNFQDDLPSQKSFEIGAVYSTLMPEIEEPMILASLRDVQLLVDEHPLTIGSYELLGEPDMDSLSALAAENSMSVVRLKEQAAELFDWLGMLQSNVLLIMIIMIVVALINVISSSLIIILESTEKISLLRALGMRIGDLQRIFLRRTIRTVAIGAVYGAIVGYLIIVLQHKFELIRLDPESYFVEILPMDLSFVDIFGVFLLSLFIVALVGWGVTRIIGKMEIAQGLKYE